MKKERHTIQGEETNPMSEYKIYDYKTCLKPDDIYIKYEFYNYYIYK